MYSGHWWQGEDMEYESISSFVCAVSIGLYAQIGIYNYCYLLFVNLSVVKSGKHNTFKCNLIRVNWQGLRYPYRDDIQSKHSNLTKYSKHYV